MPIMTENLYLGAYALTNGATLKRVLVSRSNGRRTAVFEIDCGWAQRLSDEFYSGAAIVNLGEYRRHLEGLKDELFAALKKTETERRNHEEIRKGRARSPEAPR